MKTIPNRKWQQEPPLQNGCPPKRLCAIAHSQSQIANAFILLEVLIAGVILGIVLITLSIAVGRCVHGLSVADGYRGAEQVLNDQMNLFDTGTQFKAGTLDGSSKINGRSYEWKHEVIPTEDPKLFKEVIRVRWKQADGFREEVWESYRWSENS